ncbi:hypothetical protein ABIA38_004585 [Embleya sp. AB8]
MSTPPTAPTPAVRAERRAGPGEFPDESRNGFRDEGEAR